MNQSQPTGGSSSRANVFMARSEVQVRSREKWTASSPPTGTGERSGRLPIVKDWLLIIRPDEEWNRIATGQRKAGFVFLCYLLPMMLLVALVEGHGLMLIGRHQLAAGLTNRFPLDRVCIYEITQFLLLVPLLLAAAVFIKSFGNACHHRNHLAQSLIVVFHAVGPLFFVQLLNGFPSLAVCWASWFIGMALVIRGLYHGLPRIMRPDPPSAMGLFLASSFVLFLLLFGVRLFSYGYLTGEFHVHGTFLYDLATKFSQ